VRHSRLGLSLSNALYSRWILGTVLGTLGLLIVGLGVHLWLRRRRRLKRRLKANSYAHVVLPPARHPSVVSSPLLLKVRFSLFAAGTLITPRHPLRTMAVLIPTARRTPNRDKLWTSNWLCRVQPAYGKLHGLNDS